MFHNVKISAGIVSPPSKLLPHVRIRARTAFPLDWSDKKHPDPTHIPINKTVR